MESWLSVYYIPFPYREYELSSHVRPLGMRSDGDGNGSISLVEVLHEHAPMHYPCTYMQCQRKRPVRHAPTCMHTHPAPRQMTNMILEMDLHTLGVTKDEIANYVSDEFERVDRDGSGEIDFDEFKAYYESLQEFLKDKLSIESKHTHMYTKFREEYMEARSKQLPLGDLVAICAEAHSSAPNAAVDPSPDTSPDASAAGMGLAAARSLSEGASGLVASVDGGRSGDSDGSTALNPISGALCARLTLEAHGHDFGVEVLVPPSAVGDGMRGHWIRAETVIQAQVDYFSDGTVGLGQALSPTVCVELEQPSSGPRPELRDDYTVVLPLCVGSCMDDKSEIAKGDLAVCFGRWQTGEWLEIHSDNFELLPPRPMARYGCEMPFVAVRLPRPGLVCGMCICDMMPSNPGLRLDSETRLGLGVSTQL